MDKKLYYYKYYKFTGDIELIETDIRNTPNRASLDGRDFYLTYSYYDKAEALIDIMEYINKRNGK